MTHLDPTVALLAARLRLVHLPCAFHRARAVADSAMIRVIAAATAG
jgi:hypothetical protein